MPCNSSYMEATNREIETSRVACLLDELNGKPEIDPAHWRGYHPKVYGAVTVELADELTRELCTRLQTVDVAHYSLEMQTWWRDHQRHDAQRIRNELALAADAKARAELMARLTDHEKRLLGL